MPSPREPGPGAAQPNRKCERFWTLPRYHHRVSQGRAPLSQNRKCERCWTLPARSVRQPEPAAQARRSETCSCARTYSMARRRPGLRSFPEQPPAEMSLSSVRSEPPCATGCSRAQGLSGASPTQSSADRTPGATDNTSPRSRRSGGLRPPRSGPVRPEHRPADRVTSFGAN